jgi:hypothetical protein
VKEYELYVPVCFNDGTPIAGSVIEDIGKELLGQFNGITIFPQPNEGRWKMGDVVFHDQIVIFRVLTEDVRGARKFFRQLKVKLKRELKQEEILIVEKDANAI